MNAFANLVLVFCFVAATSSAPHQGTKLPINNPSGWYSFVHNDTMTVIARHRSWFRYTIVGDSVVTTSRLEFEPKDQWASTEFASTPLSTSCLYEGSDYIYLYELLPDDKSYVVNTRISTSTYYLIPYDSSQLVIFRNYSKRLTLNSHSLYMEYGPLAYCKVSNGVASKIESIESGRISSHSLQSTLLRDTIYAVWEQTKHESFLTWMTDVKRSLVFSTYDGRSWSKPACIREINERDIQTLGVYTLHDQLFFFWAERTAGGTNDAIYYMKSEDRKHWSAPVELTRCSGFLNSWMACSDSQDRLHIVITDTRREFPAYSVFDGTTLALRYELPNFPFGELVSDRDKIYLFYSKMLDTGAGDDPGRITERVVTAEGDTVLVEMIKKDQTGQSHWNIELYMMLL